MPTARRSPLLLDTHVWIWWVTDSPELSPKLIAPLERAASQGQLCVSAISPWEVAMLEQKGRLELGMPCEAWIQRALEAAAIRLVPLSPAIAVASTRLPGSFHGDPADRIIVATARTETATLVTRDSSILTYSRTGQVACLEA